MKTEQGHEIGYCVNAAKYVVPQYFARSEEEVEFDNTIKNAIHRNGTNVDMAIYLQNQEILNLLRRLIYMEETR